MATKVQHGSGGQEQGPFSNHKGKGRCRETADIIQQSSSAELVWAVCMQTNKQTNKQTKKSGIYTQNGLVGYSGATRGRQ